MTSATVFATMMMIMRNVYRVIELTEGWRGYLITHEKYFLALDALPMVLAMGIYVVFNPGAQFETREMTQTREIGENDQAGKNPFQRIQVFHGVAYLKRVNMIPLQYMIKDMFRSSLSMADFAESHTMREMASEESVSTRKINWTAETNHDRRTGTDVRVLYTGATEHSAGFVLQKMIEDNPISKVYCVALAGNLLDDSLGLTEDQLEFLAENVDVIIHSAANRSFWDNYQIMKQVNVLPVHTLVHLAALRRIPIHFMSSVAVYLFSGRKDEDYPETRAMHPPPTGGTHGYLATKWAAEKILENASSMYGFPVYVHRPAPVGQAQRLSKATVFAEFMMFARALRLNIPRNSIQGSIDLLDLSRFTGDLLESMISNTEEKDDSHLVRYIHHRADMKLHLDEWQEYVGEHLEELDIDETDTHNATQWISKAKEIGFHFLSRNGCAVCIPI
ncbi:lovastatin nonaketide synthase [Aspergillus affinis]|uniref:lovastatin nonaketide synthase n=1 Tax=Aspergillus affinis TaxID=1070780 RepID=UPI0022FDDE8A|nr:lovastatin nonaketide synthase [Aspergillus affinis]KAI9045667.1 lovastatin nonaketide synthase [Aspergillus affinis]